MDITIRNYREKDLESIVALINAAEAHDQAEDGTSADETRSFLTQPGLIPEENVFVAQAENANLVGYAYLRLVHEPNVDSFRTWFVVHPMERQQGRRPRGTAGRDPQRGLEERLLAQLYARAQARLGECASATVTFDSFVNVLERERIAALERFGLREARRFWLMVRPNLFDIPGPKFPSGIIARAYRVKDDDVPVHAADNDAFRDHWGFAEHPLEQWLHYVSQPFFRPDLTVIAEDAATREVAGFCIIAINAEENKRLGVPRGWIDIIAVRRPYRQRGLGTALLLAGLRNLRDAGFQQAVLSCDSENTTGATRIYERVGFRVEKTRAAYRKTMPC